MTREEGMVLLRKYVNLIRNKKLRDFTLDTLGNVPDYFFVLPASSTGKYHPPSSNGDGGLLRHTLATLKMALSLFGMDPKFDMPTFQDNRDIVLTTLILHDTAKYGIWEQPEEYTRFDHPLGVVYFYPKEIRGLLAPETIPVSPLYPVRPIECPPEYLPVLSQLSKVTSAIKHHMGRWTEDYHTGKQVLRGPQTPLEDFVCLCDYLSARRTLDVLDLDRPMIGV